MFPKLCLSSCRCLHLSARGMAGGGAAYDVPGTNIRSPADRRAGGCHIPEVCREQNRGPAAPHHRPVMHVVVSADHSSSSELCHTSVVV
eukprot:45833-Eustigmatos_ZCMA.PRE.1